jgi:hypothetical protein
MERELPSFSPPSKNEQVLHSIFSNLNSTPEKEGLPIQKLQAKTSESPVSAITEASYHHRSHSKNNKSFDTLNSLDMLNFDYIQSCERQDELEKIIAILHKHKHSKLLLQEAQERLAFLTKLHNVSQIVEVDEPSLNFTLSPGSTKLHGTAFCDTMNTKLLQEPQKEPRNNTSNLKKSFTRTLQDLERAKQEAAALTFSLQTKETKNQTLSQTLQTLQSTHAITLQELQQQRIFLHKQKETQEEIQTKYTKTLDTLSKELKQAKQTTNLVKGAEKALRQQKERLWQEETAKNESLQNELRSAHNNLERMKHRQAKFRMELFRSMGMTLTQVSSVNLNLHLFVAKYNEFNSHKFTHFSPFLLIVEEHDPKRFVARIDPSYSYTQRGKPTGPTADKRLQKLGRSQFYLTNNTSHPQKTKFKSSN